MNNKLIIGVVVVALIAVVGLAGWYLMNSDMASQISSTDSNSQTQNTANQGNTNTTNNQVKGTMYFTLTDAAVDMKNVTAVNMTIDKVELYSQVHGWITASATPQTFSLLDLKSKRQVVLLAKVSVPAGTYKQFRIHTPKVMITASGKTQQAVMPSNTIAVTTDVMVNANTNSAAQFDILAEKSLHVTQKGEYVFAPVVAFDSRVNATVQVGSGNVMSVSFGQTNARVNAGMDVDGAMKTNFMIDANANLDVTGGVIKVSGVTNLVK